MLLIWDILLYKRLCLGHVMHRGTRACVSTTSPYTKWGTKTTNTPLFLSFFPFATNINYIHFTHSSCNKYNPSYSLDTIYQNSDEIPQKPIPLNYIYIYIYVCNLQAFYSSSGWKQLSLYSMCLVFKFSYYLYKLYKKTQLHCN